MPKQSKGSKRQKQQSLLGYFQHSSSPPRPRDDGASHRRSSVGPSSISPRAKKPRRQVTTSPKKQQGPSRIVADDGESTSESSDVAAIHFEPEVIALTDSDEDVKKSPHRTRARKRRVNASDSSDASHSFVQSESDEKEVGVPLTWKGKGKSIAKRKAVVLDSDSEGKVPPKKRKLVRGVRPPTPEESDDLLEELDQDKVIESRFRARNKKSAFLKNLEKLKRKKLKESTRSESESEDEGGEDGDDGEVLPFAHARPSKENHGDILEEDEPSDNEDTFIIEDDHAVELPTEFSMSTYQDLRHHFKIICQLFVHCAVQDSDDRKVFMEDSLKSQYFSVPLQVARRKLSGMRDSLVASSVWRPHFRKPLETYPKFEVIELAFAEPGCDACHLGGRLSTRIGRLSGDPYDKVSFEPEEEKDDTSEDSYDDEHHADVPKKEFRLGRFCARRARIFHQFTHWEYALYKALDDEVQGLCSRQSGRNKGRNVFVPVAFAGGAVPPEDPKDADGIMTWLDERHIIEIQWMALKKMMDDARNLDVAAKKGDDAND